MELYQKHVLLYGLRNLIPVAIVIDAHDRTKKPKIMVQSFECMVIIHTPVLSFQYDDESCHMDKSHNKKVHEIIYQSIDYQIKSHNLIAV